MPKDLVPQEAALPASLLESARKYAKEARAENTRKAYQYHGIRFQIWCESNGRAHSPASPETLIGYITHLAETPRKKGGRTVIGYAVSTIELILCAIDEAHKVAGWESPRRHRLVTEVLKGIRRKKGTKQEPKKAILAPQLVRLLEETPSGDDIGGLLGDRDRALLALGFAGAFRRSELVALNVEDIEDAPQKKGIYVRIRKSKTDQEKAGATIIIPFSKDPNVCAVSLLRTWLDSAGIVHGAIFRRVDRWENVGERLTPQQVARSVKKALLRVGATKKDTEKYGGHSLRAGLATSAAQAGKPTHIIKRQGRWASSQTLDRYIRDIDLLDGNAAEGLT